MIKTAYKLNFYIFNYYKQFAALRLMAYTLLAVPANRTELMESKRYRYACAPESPAVDPLVASRNGEGPPLLLTCQEKRVLNLLAEALSNKEIAAELGISPCTVKRHLENILRKLNLKNRVDAAIYAVRNGHVLSKSSGNSEVA